jgi:hypothetical protein
MVLAEVVRNSKCFASVSPNNTLLLETWRRGLRKEICNVLIRADTYWKGSYRFGPEWSGCGEHRFPLITS